MTESPNRTAISLVDSKEAALYFDYVVPFDLSKYLFEAQSMRAIEVEGDAPWYTQLLDGPHLPHGLSKSLLPPDMQSSECMNRLGDLNGLNWIVMSKYMLLTARGIDPFQLPEDEAGYFELPYMQFYFGCKAFMNDYDLVTTPVDCPLRFLAESTPDASEIAITLASLSLINASNAPWEQILEFRQDTEAREKLRRLRLFALENYIGKSNAYIEDHISVKISDYEAARKKWGFETKYGAFSMLLSSKILAGALGGTLVSALVGKPGDALASAAIGFGLELGRIVFELKKQQFALRDLMAQNPVSYISEARSTVLRS